MAKKASKPKQVKQPSSSKAPSQKTNQKAIEIIKNSESLKLEAYYCPAGKLTIGYGHTRTAKLGMRITKEKAEELLIEDLEYTEKVIDRLVKAPLNNNQFSALVSFVFNIGEGHFEGSTALKLLNEGKDCSGQFGRWIRSNGRILNGLIKRREEERKLFTTPPGEILD